ncbi:MAG: hypothetical protein HF314_16955 [Ignavibacteria bacterium]|jgi:hypothetical protein|nr:hypothetical protein [Ignavibacteria bacterium]MCU7504775.1 hypothetical protein [Ignavibacteria bacterium]MCU7518356.1 hypothetical protein [Ignavibacteria bacterium]
MNNKGEKEKGQLNLKILLSFLLFEFLSVFLGKFISKDGWYDTIILPSIMLFIFTVVYFLKIEKFSDTKSTNIAPYFLSVEGLFLGKLLDYAVLIMLYPSSYPGITQVEEGFPWLILLFAKSLIVFSISFFIAYAYYRMRKSKNLANGV